MSGPAAHAGPDIVGRVVVSLPVTGRILPCVAQRDLPAAGRRASTRLDLAGPPDEAGALEWRLRATDVDRLGHVNNAAYWAPVEEHLAARLRLPHRALLEYRQPLDLGDIVELRVHDAGLWFTVDGAVRAAAILGA